MRSVPTVRLPVDPLPEGYWQPDDLGHIEETEGYPNLPPVTEPGAVAAYLWIPSVSLTSLQEAIDALKKVLLSAAAGAGVNALLIVEAKEKLMRAEKEMKILENKDGADKLAAIEIATKLAKKLKKGKKGAGEKKKAEK